MLHILWKLLTGCSKPKIFDPKICEICGGNCGQCAGPVHLNLSKEELHRRATYNKRYEG